MTRGHEPYDDGEFGPKDGGKVVQLLKRGQFPPLGKDDLDQTIHRCWNGEYSLLKDLANETKLLHGAIDLPRAVPLGQEYCSKVRKECQQLIDDGLLSGINDS